jgi:hypothetical protein
MDTHDERRRERRFSLSGAVYVAGETAAGAFQVRGELKNLSARGLAFMLKDRLPAGTIVWCAAPAHSLYERAQVCHSGGSLFRRRITGVRFLAPPLARDPG